VYSENVLVGKFEITNTMALYSSTFTLTAGQKTGRISFLLGKNTEDVIIDDVVLTE
jgi:hypothetical protein